METTEEMTVETIEVKKEKRERTQAQKDALDRAREKAMQVRQESAKERSKLKEIENHEKEQKREVRRKRIEDEYNKISGVKAEDEKPEVLDDEGNEEEIEYIKKPKKKKVIRVVESSSEDEIEFRLPRKRVERTQTDIDREKQNIQLERTMRKLFTIQ